MQTATQPFEKVEALAPRMTESALKEAVKTFLSPELRGKHQGRLIRVILMRELSSRIGKAQARDFFDTCL